MTDVRLVIPDIHVPFHDLNYTRLIPKIIGILKKAHSTDFRGIIQLGDAVDFWQLSRFDKDPLRKQTVHEDLLIYGSLIDEWEAALPAWADFWQLEGNHCDRLRRYIWSKAPDLLKLVRSVPEVLRFGDRNRASAQRDGGSAKRFKWFGIEAWQACRIGDTAFHHGHFYNKHVAVGNLDRYPLNLVSGHTHRVQFASNGARWSVSLGHGSNEDDTGHMPVPHGWQQAFGVFTSVAGKGNIEVVNVANGKCVFRGKVIE